MEATDLKAYLARTLSQLGLSHIAGSWEEVWIEHNGVRLYASVWEAGSGQPTVVFIPGTSIYALVYCELLYGLRREGFNVVGFDPRGQGQSSGRRGDYTIMEHVADARAACAYARQRFGGPVFVMGSSQGGIEAFYLAATEEAVGGCICHNLADLTAPESVRLTRFGPKKPGGSASTPAWLQWGAAAGRTMLTALAQLQPYARVPLSAYLDLKAEPLRHYGNAWNFILQDPLALTSITLRAAASLAGTPLPRAVSQIQTPILVLHSSQDNIFPEDYILKIFNQLSCPKEIKIYPDLPHLITIEHVPRILPDVAGWLRKMSR